MCRSISVKEANLLCVAVAHVCHAKNIQTGNSRDWRKNTIPSAPDSRQIDWTSHLERIYIHPCIRTSNFVPLQKNILCGMFIESSLSWKSSRKTIKLRLYVILKFPEYYTEKYYMSRTHDFINTLQEPRIAWANGPHCNGFNWIGDQHSFQMTTVSVSPLNFSPDL